MTMPLRCRCGTVRGELDTDRAYVRATCYCKDCRAFATFLAVPGVVDPSGGVDIVAAAPPPCASPPAASRWCACR